MTPNAWIKDVLFIGVGLAALLAVATWLTATDRIGEPDNFRDGAAQRQEIKRTATQLDSIVSERLAQQNLQPAPLVDFKKIARRLSLALTGSVPSVEELRELEKIAVDDRVDWFVAHLLEDRRCSDYLAERFSRALVGVDEGPFLVYRRRRFVAWLSEQLHSNRPYDGIVREILTGTGLWTDSPAVNYYTCNIIPDVDEDTRPDPIRLAGRTSRAFLGMRIDCLQCHDDFIGTMNLGSTDDPVEGTQQHFHALASFFSQVENSLVGIQDNPVAAAYRFESTGSAESQAIAAAVPFNFELVDDSESNLRVRLSDWLTHTDNRPFARSIVNRVWAIMFGRGLIQVVDDIPLSGPFPEPMEFLVDDFVEHGFDLHRLIRITAATSIFQRDSIADFEITDLHEDSWAVFPVTRLRPEQVAGAVIQSTSLITIDSTAHILTRLAMFGEQTDFVNRFGDRGEDEFLPATETITQRLLMLNGALIKERLENGLNSSARIAILAPDVRTAIETVYLATLARTPRDDELEYFQNQLDDLTGESKSRGIEDLYWTLINSAEFAWNH